jgi:hypothetical protein
MQCNNRYITSCVLHVKSKIRLQNIIAAWAPYNFKYIDNVDNFGKFRLFVSTLMVCQADFMLYGICVAIIYSSKYKKMKHYKNYGPQKFHVQQEIGWAYQDC